MPPFENEVWKSSREMIRKALSNNKRIRGSHPRGTGSIPGLGTNDHVDGRIVRKKVRRVESRMEYYWELRSKNAQKIKILMCPL